jgi:Asp-tRNA(Asn)/Glu-tRNA(Gln) amidotransferase A subunit family amidase
VSVTRVVTFEEDGLQPVSRACRDAVRAAAAALADAGIAVSDEELPGAVELRGAFDTILAHELTLTTRSLVEGRTQEVMPYVAALADAAGSFDPSFESYLQAWQRVAEVGTEATRWLYGHGGVALGPVAPDVAPPVGVFAFPPVDGEPTRPGGKLSLCTFASVLGLPALAVPVGRAPGGLPVGVQLIGRRGEERTLICLAGILERALGGWIDPEPAAG